MSRWLLLLVPLGLGAAFYGLRAQGNAHMGTKATDQVQDRTPAPARGAPAHLERLTTALGRARLTQAPPPAVRRAVNLPRTLADLPKTPEIQEALERYVREARSIPGAPPAEGMLTDLEEKMTRRADLAGCGIDTPGWITIEGNYTVDDATKIATLESVKLVSATKGMERDADRLKECVQATVGQQVSIKGLPFRSSFVAGDTIQFPIESSEFWSFTRGGDWRLTFSPALRKAWGLQVAK